MRLYELEAKGGIPKNVVMHSTSYLPAVHPFGKLVHATGYTEEQLKRKAELAKEINGLSNDFFKGRLKQAEKEAKARIEALTGELDRIGTPMSFYYESIHDRDFSDLPKDAVCLKHPDDSRKFFRLSNDELAKRVLALRKEGKYSVDVMPCDNEKDEGYLLMVMRHPDGVKDALKAGKTPSCGMPEAYYTRDKVEPGDFSGSIPTSWWRIPSEHTEKADSPNEMVQRLIQYSARRSGQQKPLAGAVSRIRRLFGKRG